MRGDVCAYERVIYPRPFLCLSWDGLKQVLRHFVNLARCAREEKLNKLARWHRANNVSYEIIEVTISASFRKIEILNVRRRSVQSQRNVIDALERYGGRHSS